MSEAPTEANGSIETGTNWRDETTIQNVDEIAEQVNEHYRLMPDGEKKRFEVDNPHLNGNPTFLRVVGPRKGLWFKVIKLLKDWGFEVADLWQYEKNVKDDVLCMKVEPKT